MGKAYPGFPYFSRFVGVALPSQQVCVQVWHRGGLLWERWLSRLAVLVVLVLWPIDAAHGGTYRGFEKEIFLRVWLRQVEYRAIVEVVFLGNGGVGLGKMTPRRLRGWARGEPLCKKAGGGRRRPWWPSWWGRVQVFFLRETT